MPVTAIILAAGKGLRMKSDLPKVLHEVCGRPMLAYVVDACRQAGVDRLIGVIGHQAALVRQAFTQLDGQMTWVEQRHQLGSGHAIMVCREHLERLSGPVLVVAGDGPLIRPSTLRALLETHRRENAACTLATSILANPGRYGRIIRNDQGELQGIVEYLDATEQQRRTKEVNVSLYCFDAASLLEALGRLTNHNAKNEYYLTDVLGLLKARGKTLAAVPAVPQEDVVGVNTLEELQEVNRIMAARSNREGKA